MTITITAFADSPDEGQGLARDMRVRWALEELGLPYDVRLVSFEGLKQADHRARNPFGQIPTFEEDGLVLFESGAIILHLAGRQAGLLPDGPEARARAVMWLVAALNTVEPPIVEREAADLTDKDKSWYDERVADIDARIRDRLAALSARLGDADWLDGPFTAGDLMMVMVLRRAEGTGLVEEHPNLAAYKARGEARPAYQRAFAAQLAVFKESAAAG